MCNGWGAPGNRTIGSGKIGSSRAKRKYYTGKAKARRTGENSKQGPGIAFLTPQTVHPCCVCASSLCRSSCRPPEALECSPIRGFTELLERALSNLADTLPGDSHQRPDLLERHGFAAFFEAVVEIEDLALTRRQVLVE